MKIIKGILAFFDWLLVPHGYTQGIIAMMVTTGTTGRVAPVQYKCKVCGKLFWSFKRNKTCQNPVCFIKWRVK